MAGCGWLRPSSTDFFLSQVVLAARFHQRLKAGLAQEHPAELARIPPGVWRQKWVVDVQPVGSGESPLKYLSAYVYCIALGNQRLMNDQDRKIIFQ
jgi:hypothetical protein